MTRDTRTRAGWFFLGLLCSGCVIASEFAWQRRVSIPTTGQGLYRLVLDEQAYLRLHQNDLTDVALFDPVGNALPLARVNLPLASPERPGWYPVDWFVLPFASETSMTSDVQVYVERGQDGRLRRLETHLQNDATSKGNSGDGGDWLVDLGERAQARALRLQLPSALSFDWRLRVQGSDDLLNWRWVTDAGLLRLQREGLSLEQNRVSLPPTAPRYLRLQRADGGPLPKPSEVEVEICHCAPEQASQQHRASPQSVEAKAQQAGRFEFLSAGPFAVDAVLLDLQGSADLATVRVFSRADPAGEWRWRGEGTVFRLAETANTRIALLQAVRDREWRIETAPPLAQSPGLNLHYLPDQFLLMPGAHTEVLFALGSAESQEQNYPLDVALAEMRSRQGKDWLPPMLALGAETVRSGDAALRPVAQPLPWKRLLLWAVLVVGVATVVVMIRQLLRSNNLPPNA